MCPITVGLLLFCLQFAAVQPFDHVSREQGLPLTYRTAVHGIIPWQYRNFYGGQLATIAEHPWTANLQLYGRHLCSAALIGNRKLLTSATCTHQVSARSLLVRLGADDIRTGGRLHFVQRIYEHSAYNATSLENDISVLGLRDAVDLGRPEVAVIALPGRTDATTEVDELVVWSGWEVCEGCGADGNLLKTGRIGVMGREQCDGYYRGGVDAGMMCGGTRALRDGEVLEAHEKCQSEMLADRLWRRAQMGAMCWWRLWFGVTAAIAAYGQVFIRALLRTLNGLMESLQENKQKYCIVGSSCNTVDVRPIDL